MSLNFFVGYPLKISVQTPNFFLNYQQSPLISQTSFKNLQKCYIIEFYFHKR
jgi:hypothetical protein